MTRNSVYLVEVEDQEELRQWLEQVGVFASVERRRLQAGRVSAGPACSYIPTRRISAGAMPSTRQFVPNHPAGDGAGSGRKGVAVADLASEHTADDPTDDDADRGVAVVAV